MEKKHAYLIMVHQFDYILETLLRLIDDERNDIYVHVDKKVRDLFEDKIMRLVKNSELYFVKRHKVYWGHVSQLCAEYELFQTACMHGGYCRYHLISGSDLPIKSQDVIHDFFDSHKEEEFVAFWKNDMVDRVKYKWIFPRHLRGMCTGRYWIGRKINNVQWVLAHRLVDFQKWIGCTNRAFPIYKKCTNWVSITENAVRVLLWYKKKVIRGFRLSSCPDEHYKATIFYCVINGMIPWPKGCMEHLSFYKYPETEIEKHNLQDFVKDVCDFDAARYIDWMRGGPLELTMADWDRIVNSDAMFCRKVIDEKLAEKLYERCMQ